METAGAKRSRLVKLAALLMVALAVSPIRADAHRPAHASLSGRCAFHSLPFVAAPERESDDHGDVCGRLESQPATASFSRSRWLSAHAAQSVSVATGATSRVSVSSAGAQGVLASRGGAISADGRFVAFASDASNLVAGDTNAVADVFVHDRETGETERVSVASDGTQGNQPSFADWGQAISADGRFVAFTSHATNLASGDTPNASDVFVRDRQTGTTEVVSSSGVSANTGAGMPAISADGRFVAFWSSDPNLVTGDTNGSSDLFVRDRETGSVERVNVASDGTQANRQQHLGISGISADGRFVGFLSDASNLVPGDTNGTVDVFVHDRLTGGTARASVSSDGAEANGASAPAAISADGRFVTFNSEASNLVPSDTNGQRDIFVHDRLTGETERVNVSSSGDEANADTYIPALSANGRFVAFDSVATNLGAPGGTWQVFVHDRQTAETDWIRTDNGAVQAFYGGTLAISADGSAVVFTSSASDLVDGDTNGVPDVFVNVRSAPPPPAPSPCAGTDAAVVGVRGAGDPDAPEVLPGRHAKAIAAYLRSKGLALFDNDDYPTDGVIGLPYPAVAPLEFVGYGLSVSTGASNLETLISSLRSLCGADFPILLAGFSQGAHVIQSALEQLDDRADANGDPTWESIAGVALLASPRFDPDDSAARGTFPGSAPRFGLAGAAEIRDRFSTVTRTYCLADDPVCQAPLQVSKCLALRTPRSVVACLAATVIDTWKTIHSQGYYPTSCEQPCELNPLMEDAAELLRWAVRRKQQQPTPPNPTGELEAYRDFLNPLNTRVSAGSVYARGAPTNLYRWDFDSDATIDTTTISPFVVHAYGVGIGRRGFDTITTTVHIDHIDGSETVRSICIRRAPVGSATC
jgi:Tol biopolymer transport system component